MSHLARPTIGQPRGGGGPSGVPRVSPLRSGDHRRAAADLAAAFRDNPLNVAVIGGSPSRRERSNRLGMRSLLAVAQDRAVVLRHGSARHPGGVLVALGPFDYPLAPPPVLWQMRCLLGQGPRVALRWSRVFRQLEAIHPMEPHAYLSILGVHPHVQGTGVGGALLRSWLESLDAEPVSAYLETDLRENVAFYGREGFEVVEEVRVMDASVWCMRRDAARAPHVQREE